MAEYKTEQRRRLMDFLMQTPDRQFSAKQIAEHLPAPQISISAIYRNLTSLENAGLITRFVKEGSREIYFGYTQAPGCQDCIHMICTKCGKTLHAEQGIADRLQCETFESADFQLDRTKTVLYGICKDCKVR